MKLILVILFLFQSSWKNELEVSSNRVEKKIFKHIEVLFGSTNVNIEKLFLNDLELYKITKNKTLGYLILTSSIGKYDFFDFAIFFTPNGKISLVRILTYREDYGGEIANKKWLEQFIGLQNKESIKNTKVQAISGATISVNSITHKIKEVSNKFVLLQKEGLLN